MLGIMYEYFYEHFFVNIHTHWGRMHILYQEIIERIVFRVFPQ